MEVKINTDNIKKSNLGIWLNKYVIWNDIQINAHSEINNINVMPITPIVTYFKQLNNVNDRLKISKPAVSWTKFDSKAPKISQLRLENSSNTIVNYTDDVCVKGSFTLKGNVKDQDGGTINKFTIDGIDVALTTNGDFEYPLNTASGVFLNGLIYQ